MGPREVPSLPWSPRAARVEDKLLEMVLIHHFLELSPERMAGPDTIAHIIVESAILPGSWSLRVGRERPRVPTNLLALDDFVHRVLWVFEQSEISFIFMDLGEVSSELVDSFNCLTQSLLRRTNLCLMFLHITPRLGDRLAKLRIASSIWIYFWARARMFLILVISCFTRCLSKE